MHIALFRPNQRERKPWIERLKNSGYSIQFVHDLGRIAAETSVVVIDTSVGRWKDFVRMVEGQGFPIVLLVDEKEAGEQWRSKFSIAGIVHPDDPVDGVFERFTDEAKEPAIAAPFPAPGRSLQLPKVNDSNESVDQTGDEATRLRKEEPGLRQKTTLSQRKSARLQPQLESGLQLQAKREPGSLMPEQSFALISELVQKGETGQEQNSFASMESTGSARRQLEARPVHPYRHRVRLPATAAVYAPKGGVGKTVFLLHLAARLAHEGQRVCVLDMDLTLGSVAVWLNIAPHKTIADLARRLDDPEASRACFLEMKKGFFVVAAPMKPASFQLQPDQLVAILHFLKEEVDVVLIDTPLYIDSLTRLVLEQCEQLYLMATNDMASLIHLERLRPVLASLRPSPEMFLVWNRLTEPAPKEKWKERLPWPTVLELPEDPTIRNAVRRGEWIADSPTSPYRLQVGRLVARWMGREETAGSKRKGLGHLWSQFKKKGEFAHDR